MADEVLAIGVTVVHTIADGRQLSFQTAFAADMDRAGKNALLDELADLSARQAARASRPALLKDLAKHEETLAQFREDMARLELEWPERKAALEATLADLQDEAKHDAARNAFLDTFTEDMTTLRKRREAEFNEGYIEHGKSGRGGEYKPRGHREANLNRLDSALKQAEETIKSALVDFEMDHQKAIEAAKAAIGAAESERHVALENLKISEKRYEQAIDSLKAQLAEADKLLEG